ncbi:DUF2961 domain-containing protein [Paenibacillus dendritiformis]|uniref:glycoside hydrolase family 172 protein n=1 Tax=Paenibacillus dendritiformis TaxID=130049 RepID=UPI00248C878E|nr:glycoside hydrolase family 172 protein [Paenibacillus dendritiformis]WGU95835.1 DUF2961 domain-containing protein [Paenibacillus dendritiformis]
MIRLSSGLAYHLPGAALLTNGLSRSISAENPTGAKGQGGRAANQLGVGRKGSPFIKLKQGEMATIAEIEGPGVIQSMWFTIPDRTGAGDYVLRDLVLRMYWDGSDQPSVEVPFGDFFCNGFGVRCNVNSLPIAVNPTGGMNCYFPMPFRSAAVITVENQHPGDIPLFYYQINYMLVGELPEEAAYFHAQWRRESITAPQRDFIILDGIRGKGHYIGTYLAWASLERYWWGEGEIKFYLDGDEEWPTICGTGTEDYFGGAWCFYEQRDGKMHETTYSTPFLGYPFYSKSDTTRPGQFPEDAVPMHGLYRWHLPDPICFAQDIRVEIQQIGHNGRELFERSDDISSVAYWYQDRPQSAFPALPAAERRRPR